MEEFGLPFSGLANDRTLMDDKIIRAVRFMVAVKYKVIKLYMQLADLTDNNLAAELLKKKADEERAHAGEFLSFLHVIVPDEEKFDVRGAGEVEKELRK
jgi:rubrerythrin